MKKLMTGLFLVLITQTSNAFERPFRIDSNAPVLNGFAVAWGISGKSLDFEKLDLLAVEDLEKEMDLSLVKNYVVDIETNTILATVREDGPSIFHVGDLHYGNHYFLSLDNLAVQGIDSSTDVIAVVEHVKWFSGISNVILVNRKKKPIQKIEIDAYQTMSLLRSKLAFSILPENLDLFENGAENVVKIEKEYLDKQGEVNVITFDYNMPKEASYMEVKVTVKMKYENSKITPYILSVKQETL